MPDPLDAPDPLDTPAGALNPPVLPESVPVTMPDLPSQSRARQTCMR